MTSFVESPDFQSAGNGTGGVLWSSFVNSAIGVGTHDIVSQGLSGGYGGIIMHIIGARDARNVQLKLSHNYSGGSFHSIEDNGMMIIEVPGTANLLNPNQDLLYYLPVFGSIFDLGRSAPVGADVNIQSVGSGVQHHGPPRVLPLFAQTTGAFVNKPTLARDNALIAAGATRDTLFFSPWWGKVSVCGDVGVAGLQVGVASFNYLDQLIALQMLDSGSSDYPRDMVLPQSCYHKLRVKNTTAGGLTPDFSIIADLGDQ